MEKILDKLIHQEGSVWITESCIEKYLATKNCGTLTNVQYAVKDGALKKIKYNGHYVYTTAYWNNVESLIATNAMRIMLCAKQEKIFDYIIESIIDEFEQNENNGLKLHKQQRNAVLMVCKHNLSILTGGPGTGKTTVLNCIAYVLRTLNPRVNIIFTAPTGKAARRISESTNEHASTVHKKFNLFGKKVITFLEDVLLVDESSMNDNLLTAELLNAIPTGKRICIIGDENQLPSVGPGKVLRDFIESGAIPVTNLTKTFRQNNNSTLFQNIQNIKDGKAEFVAGNDFTSIVLSNKCPTEDIEKQIAQIYREQIEKHGIENVCVLIPYRKSKNTVSVDSCNTILQSIANSESSGYRYTNKVDNHTFFFKKNDYVMQMLNREECANGDIGKVTAVGEDGITVEYVDSQVRYSQNEMHQLALAYAMTFHKSQGSEYQSVIIVMLNEHKNLLNRNLLYTGMTRAKKECTVLYHEEALKIACSTIADSHRISMLKKKLTTLRKQYKDTYGI